MLKVTETPDPLPPECRATVERIQRALDGASDSALAGIFGADPHAASCPACRERVRAARVLLMVLVSSPEEAAVPSGFADRVVRAMRNDRGARIRRRTYAAALSLIAAAVLVVVGWYLIDPPAPPEPLRPLPLPQGEMARSTPELAPAPREKPVFAPDPHPIRIGDEVAKAGQALLGAPKPLTESVAVAPKILDAFTGPFTAPAEPPNPMTTVIEPARRSIAELPAVARTGLEPFTGTAEKALNRFLRDVGAVKPNS